VIPENKIICGDCLEVTKDWPDNCVDLIIFDPPFSRYSGADRTQVNLGDYKILEIFFKEISFLFKRIIKPTGGIFGFCDFRTYPALFYGMFHNFRPTNLIIWQKDFIGPGTGFRPLHELIVFWRCTRSLVPKDRCLSDIWQAKRPVNKKHPHEKPYTLYVKMIENCSEQNDIVLVPFLGSGTGIKAASDLGRRYIGIDISPEYCKIAEERLEAVETGVPVKEQRKGQMALFEAKQ